MKLLLLSALLANLAVASAFSTKTAAAKGKHTIKLTDGVKEIDVERKAEQANLFAPNIPQDHYGPIGPAVCPEASLETLGELVKRYTPEHIIISDNNEYHYTMTIKEFEDSCTDKNSKKLLETQPVKYLLNIGPIFSVPYSLIRKVIAGKGLVYTPFLTNEDFTARIANVIMEDDKDWAEWPLIIQHAFLPNARSISVWDIRESMLAIDPKETMDIYNEQKIKLNAIAKSGLLVCKYVIVEIPDRSCDEIAVALQKLESVDRLDIRFKVQGHITGLENLAKQVERFNGVRILRVVSLYGNDHLSPIVEAIGKLTNIRELDLSLFGHINQYAGLWSRALENFTRLEKLAVYLDSLSEDQVLRFTRAMKSCFDLVTLRVDGVVSTNKVATELSAVIESLTHVVSLTIKYAQDAEGDEKFLLKSFASHPQLKELVLSFHKLGYSEENLLGDFLKSSKHLRTFSLLVTSPEGELAAKIVNGLQSCSRLEALSLGNIKFGITDAGALAKAISSWPQLKIFTLFGFGLGDVQVQLICKALQSSRQLIRCVLSVENIGDGGYTAVKKLRETLPNAEIKLIF